MLRVAPRQRRSLLPWPPGVGAVGCLAAQRAPEEHRTPLAACDASFSCAQRSPTLLLSGGVRGQPGWQAGDSEVLYTAPWNCAPWMPLPRPLTTPRPISMPRPLTTPRPSPRHAPHHATPLTTPHPSSPRHAPPHATPLLTTPRPCGTVTTPVTQVAHTPTTLGTGARSRAHPPTTAPSSTCARSCGGTTCTPTRARASSSRCAAALLTAWDDLPSRPRPSGRLRCGHARQPRPPILRGSTPRRDDGYEEHGEAGADFAMIGHLHEQRKQLLATIEQSESELGSVVLQLSSLESGGGLF